MTISRRRTLGALVLGPCVKPTEAQEPAHGAHLAKPRSQARGRFPSATAKSKTLDARIAALAAQVDPTRLAANVDALAALPTRWSQSDTASQALDHVRAALLANGHDAGSLRSIDFKLPDGRLRSSVLCMPKRVDAGFILLCAHYDSVSATPKVKAPGADDNASGMSVMMEIVRILRGVTLKRDVMFAAFGGEEQGLLGSTAAAKVAVQERWAIDVVINLDMVGWVDPQRPTNIILEFDQGNQVPTNDAAARAFGLQLAQAFQDHTELTVEHTDIWNSDYMPFEAAGYPCIGIYDGGSDADFYHSVRDLPAIVDTNRLAQVTRGLLAFVIQTAGLA